MDRIKEKQVSNTRRHLACKPVAVLEQLSWHDLLNPGEGPGALEPGSIRETEGLLFALAQAVEQRDHHTAGHCERLSFVSVALGIALRLDRSSLLALYRGGFLHDLGKVGIPDSILFKPGKLTEEEWIVMRSHTTRGEEICCHLKSLKPVLPIIRHHHERWDGTGYPDGLRGCQIPLLSRVLQIADIYDALTSPRPYKAAYPAQRALQTIVEETNRGWRDPEIVDTFLRLHTTVLSKIGYYNADSSLEALRSSLTNLQALIDAVS